MFSHNPSISFQPLSTDIDPIYLGDTTSQYKNLVSTESDISYGGGDLL